ncbi:MAG: hypothetical protein QOI72_647, partial [Solirubrobacterales bacterium]|nr:hypothetical protein [Solirubrobacterales bacterium]
AERAAAQAARLEAHRLDAGARAFDAA